MATLEGDASIRGSSEIVRMMLLSCVAAGMTFTWGVEMTYCTPYLLSLGLAKSTTSLIWIAGPLSGLVVQPVVGVVADGNGSAWGRRRPLMMAGAAGVAAGLLGLGFAREAVVGLGMRDDGAVVVVWAVAALCLVDFAVNAVSSCSKSLVIDTLPLEKQQTGMAWAPSFFQLDLTWLMLALASPLLLQASRMSTLGHIIGYGIGAVDLVSLFGSSLGSTQFQQLTVIASLAMIASTAVTCWAVQEAVLVRHDKEALQRRVLRIPQQVLHALGHLPPRIQAICWAQFWSWIGWFPFLFYNTTWIGEIYFRYDAAPDHSGALMDMGRIGSTVLLVFSFITFAAAVVLPLLVWAPDEQGNSNSNSNNSRRRGPYTAGFVVMLRRARPHLLTAWMCGQAMFAMAMSLAPWARSYRFASFLVYFCAISWSIAIWAPHALVGIEVNRMRAPVPHDGGYYHQLANVPEGGWQEPTSPGHGLDAVQRSPILSLSPPSPPPCDASSSAHQSGIYSGMLNVYTSLPQLVSSFMGSLVFAILEPSASTDNKERPASGSAPNAISVCLFIGALSSFVAVVATSKIKRL